MTIGLISTQEPALMSNSPPPSSPRYIVSVQRVGAGYDKVLIPNPNYKGKGRTKPASLNMTPRVLPKITASQEMEFTDYDMEDEKEELSNELVASLKQKINASEKLVAELHLSVYDQ
jgi:hypothetical protein